MVLEALLIGSVGLNIYQLITILGLQNTIEKLQALIEHNKKEIAELKKQKRAQKLFDFQTRRMYSEQITELKNQNEKLKSALRKAKRTA